MGFNNRLNKNHNFSLVHRPPHKSSLILNSNKSLIKKDKKRYSITIQTIQKNIVDFSIYSILDEQMFFKQGGYFS